ncbi:hypothetical protein KDA00_04985, partial [Candidatus Saccharibacteria bacterium]|nr:hypothetical protein [Candidatus Saccharibacteria bacterium]
DTYALWVGSGADNTDSANGITFGLSGDTNLFRAAANVLETADSLIVDDRLQIGVGNSSNTINQCQDIAIVNCTAGIELSVSSTQTINKTFGIYNQTLINPGALNSADNYASANYLILHGSQNYTGVNGGVLGQAFIIDMGGDVDNIAGVVGIAGSTNGNVGDAHGLYGSVFQYGGTGLIDNAYSIFASTGSGNITNNYGLFIENQYAVGSGENYNIFSQGQGYNLLQGHTAIGSTAQINGGGSDNIILHVAETVDSSLAGSDYGVDIAVTSDPSISGGGAVVGLRSLVETSATATQDDGWIIGIQGHASHASDQTIGAMYGIYGYSSVDFGSTGDAGLLAGTVGQVDHWGSGTVSSAASIFGITKNGSTGTINQASGGYLQVTNEGTGTIDSAYGLIVDNPTNNGTLTLNVGIAVNSMTSGDTDVGISLGTAEDYTLVISADADNTTANAGIFFGISADTNLYRGGTNQLNTDSSMDIAGHTAIGADAAVNDTNLINNASTYSTVLTIEEEFTDLTSTDQVSGIVNYIQATPASTATAGVYGIDNRIATSGANDLADITGIYSVVSHAGTGLAGNVYGQYISALNESTSGGVGNLVGSGVGTTNQDVTSAIYGQILTAVNVGTNSGTTNGQVVQAQNHGTDAGLIGQSIDVRNIGTTDVLSGLTVSVANSGTISSGLSYGIVVTSANTASLHLSSEVDSTTQGGGIVFGSSRDTNLYRGAANVLTTDDIFAVGTLGTANTATYLCRNGSLQISTCDTTIGGAAFVHGGNSFGSTAIFGTQDDNDIAIIVGNNQAVLIADEGAVTFQNEVDTTSGFSILDADGGNPVLNVDTTNERVGIGTATPSYSLDVVGDANFSSSLQIGESVDVGTISQCLTVLGLAPCKAGLDVAERSSEDSSPSYGIHNIMIVNPAGDSTAVNLGIQTELIVGNATTQNFSGLSIADKAKLWGGTTGTISYGWGVSGEVTNTLAGTITEAVAVRGAVDQIGAGTINTAVALQAASGAYSAGTVDNNYGIWAQAQNTSATNDYGVRIDTAQTQTLWIAGDQANPTTSSQGIAFGSSRDVDLYRSASNTLRTSDSLIIDTNLGVNNTSAPNRVNVNTLTTADPDAELAVSTGADDKKGIIVQAVSGQTANLQEWQDDAGAALASISATGDLYVKNAFVDGDLLIKGHITALNPNGDTTTVVAGAGAGTGASATVTGSDVAGYVVVNTGTGSGTGTLATVTFANAHGSGIYGPSIVLTPKNGNGATIQYFASTSSQTTFTIDSNNAPTDSTTYEYYYHVIAFDLSD